MKKRQLILVTLAAAILLSLSACAPKQEKLTAEDATAYVQKVMDQYYLGKYDADFLTHMEMSREEAEAAHRENLDIESGTFATYFKLAEDPAALDPALLRQLQTLYEQIYQQARYVILPATKLESGSYGVEIKIQPIDVIQNVEAAQVDYLIPHMPKNHTQEEIDAMSEADYKVYSDAWDAFNAQYPQLMVDLLQEEVAQLGYLAEKTFVLQVKHKTVDEADSLYIEADDQLRFDEYIIYYPKYSNYKA